MSGIGSGYDYSVSTFSPDGKVFQTEYAQKAVDNGGTTIGLKCMDGVVLAVEKAVVSKLLVEGSERRIFAAAQHIGLAASGLPADGRQVTNRVSDECTNYKRHIRFPQPPGTKLSGGPQRHLRNPRTLVMRQLSVQRPCSFYGEVIPGHVLAERIGAYLHLFNCYGALRPFGTAHLMAAHDRDGAALYLLETSGVVHRFFGTAVGKHRQAAKSEIEKLKLSELTCRQALTELAKMFLSQRDDQKPHELEMGWLCEATGFKFERVPAVMVAEAEAAAKALLHDADMDDD